MQAAAIVSDGLAHTYTVSSVTIETTSEMRLNSLVISEWFWDRYAIL